MEEKEKANTLDRLSWLIGTYMIDAMGVWWGKNSNPYPSQPRSMNNTTNKAPNGEVMTDGAKFAAFAAAHNKQIRERRKR